MDVNIDVDHFMKDLESIMKHRDDADSVDDEGSRGSSELDFDELEEGSADEDEEESFMDCYSDALSQELKSSTVSRSFVHGKDHQPGKPNEGDGDGGTAREMEEDFRPVDVDVNLVKSLLESISSQEGLPGPASNILGLMGLKLPAAADSNKKK